MPPIVSVVIVNWNSGRMLRHVVACLESQTFRDFEVIVVDNASSDDSLADLPAALPRLRVVRNERNLGFAAANNLAAKLATGRWLALLNPDAFPAPRWLEELVKATEEYPGFSMFGSKQVLEKEPHLLDGVGDVYHVSGLIWREGHGQPVEQASRQPVEIFSPCGAAALFEREAFLAAGSFDEDFFCYAEDIDLGFRLRLVGHRALFVPAAVVFHVHAGTTNRRSDFSAYHGHRNLIWAFFKNMPIGLLVRYLPFHLLINAASLARLGGRGQLRIGLKAKLDGLRGLPGMLAKRRSIQASRRASTSDLLSVMARGWPTPGAIARHPFAAPAPALRQVAAAQPAHSGKAALLVHPLSPKAPIDERDYPAAAPARKAVTSTPPGNVRPREVANASRRATGDRKREPFQ